MTKNEDEILDQSVEDLLNAQIKRHKEKSKLHLEQAAELQKKLDLIKLPSTKKGRGPGRPIKKKSVSHKGIEISKSETEDFMLQNPDKTYKTEELVEAMKPEYLKDPTVRKVAINKMSQILFASMKQQRIKKFIAAGRGNKYGITKSYLEKKVGLKDLFSQEGENKKPLANARG